jgi:hypothetical protein
LDAVIVYENKLLGAALAARALLITGVLNVLIVRLSVFVPVPEAFVALKETAKAPLVVGVPEITPVDVLIERPAGSPPAAKLCGEFEAAME